MNPSLTIITDREGFEQITRIRQMRLRKVGSSKFVAQVEIRVGQASIRVHYSNPQNSEKVHRSPQREASEDVDAHICIVFSRISWLILHPGRFSPLWTGRSTETGNNNKNYDVGCL